MEESNQHRMKTEDSLVWQLEVFCKLTLPATAFAASQHSKVDSKLFHLPSTVRVR